MNCLLRNYGKLHGTDASILFENVNQFIPSCFASGGVPCELALIELVIEALTGQQILMAPLFNDVTVLHNKDEISFPDGGKPPGS